MRAAADRRRLSDVTDGVSEGRLRWTQPDGTGWQHGHFHPRDADERSTPRSGRAQLDCDERPGSQLPRGWRVPDSDRARQQAALEHRA